MGTGVRVALAVRHVMYEDLGTFAPILESSGFEVRYCDVGVDSLNEQTFLDPDLVVILGGPIGVYDSDLYPVLIEEKAAIRARLAAQLPTLGVCLGAQLMADALGADVAPTGKKEIGYRPLSLTSSGLASPLAPLDGAHVLHWHGDQFAIPEGATRLAETDGFAHQAFALGSYALGLQFHLEADSAHIEQWLIGHADELFAARIDIPRIRRDALTYGDALRILARQVVTSWLTQAGLTPAGSPE